MTNHSTDNDFILNGTFLPPETIILSSEQIEWALELSQSVTPEPQQWQTYLNALALAGVDQWLQKRAPELTLNSECLSRKESDFLVDSSRQSLTLMRPTDATFSESICQLQVNEFNLYLIVTDSLYDTNISISRTAVESAQFIPHFYVLVEVLEELEQTTLRGYLRRDHLIHQQESIGLRRESDTTYLLPIDWFEPDSDKLLLCLLCLDPAAIPVLSHQQSTLRSSPLSSPVQQSNQPAINAGLWLKDQLDRVAQDLSWILLPPLSLTPEFRALRPACSSASLSPVEQFNDAIAQLRNQGDMAIPSKARGVYRDLQWENVALRLYVVAWELPATDSVPEWTLLLILGAQPNATLPLGIKLQVRDEVQILEEPVLTDRSQDYLYARVIGTHNERFWVTIALAGGTALTLPPFTFDKGVRGQGLE
jgi:hypothetical protein